MSKKGEIATTSFPGGIFRGITLETFFLHFVTNKVTIKTMIKNFRHNGLETFYLTGNKTGIQPKHADRLRLILARLDAACEPKDMNLPGLRLHKLSGRLKDFWAVNVSGNWRVIFRFKGQDVIDIDYLDYH